jgi:hypothetical protein
VVGFEVVAETPIVIHPDAMSGRDATDRRGEISVAVPVLVVGGGECEAEGELRGEGRSEVLRGKARGEDRHRSGDGKEVARGAGEEDENAAEEEDRDPEDKEECVGVAALAPRGDGERRNEGREEDEPTVDQQHHAAFPQAGEVDGEVAR